MKAKSGVIFNASSQIIKALPIIDEIYKHFGFIAVITSCKDGRHMKGSKHHSERGNLSPSDAVDLRTRFFTIDQTKEVAFQLRSQLGKHYDVVVEIDHIHLEYDYKN